MIKHYESGDTVFYNNKKCKIVKPIGHYNDNLKQLEYDYVIYNKLEEKLDTVSEKDLSEYININKEQTE